MKTNIAARRNAISGRRPLHPVQAMLLSFPLTMFVAAFLSDLAYAETFQIQWSNFASWLIVGGLLGGGFCLLWALIELARSPVERTRRTLVFAGLLLVLWGLGFVDALVHAKDAWAIMPEAPWLSAASAVLSIVAAWIGFSGLGPGERE